MPFGQGARGGITAITLELVWVGCGPKASRTTFRAKDMLLALHVAPGLGDKLAAPFTTTSPTAVGSATSRYTFNGLSPEAWLGIVLGLRLGRWEFPRIHPICICSSMDRVMTPET